MNKKIEKSLEIFKNISNFAQRSVNEGSQEFLILF